MEGQLTFLGTGTSMGVPTLGCGCVVCASADPRDRRLRPSVLLQWHDGSAIPRCADRHWPGLSRTGAAKQTDPRGCRLLHPRARRPHLWARRPAAAEFHGLSRRRRHPRSMPRRRRRRFCGESTTTPFRPRQHTRTGPACTSSRSPILHVSSASSSSVCRCCTGSRRFADFASAARRTLPT